MSKERIAQIKKRLQLKQSMFTLNMKLNLFAYGLLILFTILIIYLMLSLVSFCNSYNQIVKNITAANQYNLDFKEDVDYVMYRMIVSMSTSKEIEEKTGLKSPYIVINEARQDFKNLLNITTGTGNEDRIDTILKSLNTLEKRVREIDDTVKQSGHYDENIVLLDNNIRILTELTQEEIQKYIYYEASNMESVRKQLEMKEQQALSISTLCLLLIVGITSVASLGISNSVSKPIQKLCKTTELVAKGDFNTRAEISHGNEISMLNNSFNSMIGQIGDLIEHIKEEQNQLRDTELRLLQAQINPHFLYNTLDTIIWLAEDRKSREVVSMVTSLSDFFRTVLSDGRDSIRISEEVSHIRSYLEIQQFRYSDILEYEIEVPDEVSNHSIIKLTLQPLVENALYHGIKNKRGMGKITVTGEQIQDNIYLYVTDNGIGMTEHKLLELNSMLGGRANRIDCEETSENTGNTGNKGNIENAEKVEKELGFGIVNVAERIKLNYGEEYGIFYESEYGAGTKVTVKIPAKYVVRQEKPVTLQQMA